MAQQQAQPNDLAVIYDPASKRWLTAADLNAGGGQPPAPAPGSIGINGPGGEFAGVSLPPMAGGDAQRVFDAAPQMAGLVAQLHPALRGAKASMAIPAVVDVITKKLQGENPDLEGAVIEALGGLFGHGVGKAVTGVGDLGTSLVRRSMNLAGTPFANRTGETMLPKLAIENGAQMTRDGVDAIAAKAKATGLGGLDDLAEVLERARLGASLGPVGGGGGIMAAVRDMFSPPRQMAAGQALAQPFGVNTKTAIAPAAEGAVRAFMAWLDSELGQNQPAQQTRRRPLP